MVSCLCELVKFHSKNSYIYTGLLFRSGNSRRTVIHVHGSCGDFISFGPLKTVANHYISNNSNFLTFNLKGHDCIAEGNWLNGRYDYVGGSLVDFDECINDIQSAIDYCKLFSDTILLQGHSLGCDRIVYYQLLSNCFYPTILLSPCDSYKLQQIYLNTKSVEKFITEVEGIQPNNDFEMLPPGSYGVNNAGECYDIPITQKALLSIMTGPPYKLFKIGGEEEYYLPVDAIVCLGSNDKLQVHSPEVMHKHFRNKFKSVVEITIEADHEMEPKGDDLGNILSAWISKVA